jgi:molybdopterin-containing oxidoreductase family membrane subunit
MNIWPQFRSPLIWDVFAVSTYFTVSLLFWYVGLIPDLATMRDRAVSKFKRVAFGVVSLGWRGAARHWHRYEVASLILAGLSTPLVLSVHTVVSFDFAVSLVPGWHTTIFPPYFVAGAIYSGFAMVLTLAIPISRISSPCATSTTWRKSCWRPASSSATATRWKRSLRGTARLRSSGS